MSNSLTRLDGASGLSGGLFPSQMQRAIQRELERTIGNALVTCTRERARAAMTAEVLESTGALTVLESHLIQIAPLGEARYKHIVDGFVMGATAAITRL